ncbi:MAG: class I SAM-dependent methyltransferase [Thermodesulfobacteriota bacterium]|nr:class I SAM-dependent methyltransferase [Thermodesulfobacteriota bacterium]
MIPALIPIRNNNRTDALAFEKDLRVLRCPICEAESVKFLYPLPDFSIVRCRRCGLVFSTLPVDRFKLERMYGDAYFESRREYFFENPIVDSSKCRDNDNIRNFRHGLSLVNRYASKGRLLDVGCALGAFLSLARDQGWETHGVDISKYAASYCHKVLGHDAVAGDLMDMQFPGQRFDVVTLWDVLEHFHDPAGQLRAVHNILKKNGIVLLDTPNEDGLLRLLARLSFLASKGRFAYPVRKLYHHFHLLYFSPKTLEILLERNGFSLIHLEKRPIPHNKGRANPAERVLLKLFSGLEKILDKEYELLAVAKKVG